MAEQAGPTWQDDAGRDLVRSFGDRMAMFVRGKGARVWDAEGREYLVEAPHLSVAPGLAFLLTVVGFNLVAEGMRQRLDPKHALGVY